MVPARTPKDDWGNLQTLEAVIVILLMTSAVVFVTSIDAPPTGSTASRTILQQQAQDALTILYDTPLKGKPNTNVLSEYVLECLQGNCDNLTRKVEKVLPEGAQYGIYMSNGHALFTIYEPRPPSGEAVSARHYFEPAWSHTFLGTGISYVNPNSDGLLVYALPVYKSNPISEGGSPIQVRVEGTRVSDNATYVLTASYSTRAFDASQVTQASAVSLTFIAADGSPLAVTNATAHTLTGLSPSLAPLTMRLRLSETAGVRIPAGTTLTIQTPAGWLASANQSANPGWQVTANATDKNASFTGAEIKATLLSSLSGSTQDFTFEGVYFGAAIDYYPFTAVLGSGAGSHGSLLVRADKHGTQPDLEIPRVLMSLPRPMGALATTTWTLAATVPEGANLLSNDAVDVTRVTITEENGAAIFGSVTPIAADGGTWAQEGTRLIWTGVKRVQHDSPLNLTFQVSASGIAGSSEVRPAFIAPITFDGWTGRIAPQVSPGLFRGTFLPATSNYHGYNGSSDTWLWTNHTFSTNGVYRTSHLPGTASYHSAPVNLLRDSLYGSSIDFASRKVPVGGQASLEIDVQSTLYALAELGITPNVTLRIHPPWATDGSRPLITKTLFNGSALTGSLLNAIDTNGDGNPEPSNYGHYNSTANISETWLFGTYVTEVQLDWTESVSKVVSGTPVSQSVVRTARIYDYFVVTPPDGLSPPSPIYDVHLVTWFDDWR